MRLVIQRVSEAAVTIDGVVHNSIARGLMILVGVEQGDTMTDLDWIVAKCLNMRIFDDQAGVMNLSVKDVAGEILAISQFTLTASTRKGNRPSYIRAERPEIAESFYLQFCEKLSQQLGREVKRGIFGADMKVSLINDGPVTIIIDSKLKE
ncbi:MAG: D-aminoacyl-tRNA deacylase [Bacteroidales bacterium]